MTAFVTRCCLVQRRWRCERWRMKQHPPHILRHLIAVALIALSAAPAWSEPVAKLERHEGKRQIEEIRIYMKDGTHLTNNITVLPVTVRIRISGERPMTASEEDEVLAAAVTCVGGYPRAVVETREGAGEKEQKWIVNYDCITPGG